MAFEDQIVDHPLDAIGQMLSNGINLIPSSTRRTVPTRFYLPAGARMVSLNVLTDRLHWSSSLIAFTDRL